MSLSPLVGVARKAAGPPPAGVADLDALAETLCLVMLQQERQVFWRRGDQVAASQLAAGVVPSHLRHHGAVLSALVAAGLLEREGELLALGPHAHEALVQRDAVRSRARRHHPRHLELLEHVVAALPALWRGAAHPFEVLFPRGSVALMRGVYCGNPLADRTNRIIAACVGHEVAAIRDHAPAVLEVGGGTGGTTGDVLRAVGEARYIFTDVSPAFLTAARQRFPGCKTATYDVGHDPTAQGLETGSCDVVLATNALHTAPLILPAVQGLRTLLRPGGLLVLGELTRVHSLWTVCAGVLDGWWTAADSRLPDAPLLSREGWERVLGELFSEIAFVDEHAGPYGQDVILAR